MSLSRVIFTVPLLYQQLFFCPQPPTEAPAAPTVFNLAQTTTTVPFRRTLHYQAKIAPPVVPPVVDNINAQASVTTGRAFKRTVFYQAVIQPPPQPPTAVVAATIEWAQPLSRPLAQAPAPTTRYVPFVPSPAPQVTADEWLQPFRRNVAGPFPVHTQPVTAYPPTEVVTLTTTLEWLQAWQGPSRRLLLLASGSPFVPKEATLENTPPEGWDLALDGYSRFPRQLLGLPGGQPFVPKEATLENTVPPGWMQPFYKAVPPPRPDHTQPVSGYPGAPAITADEWLQPFQKAVATPPAHHTQPVSGYAPAEVNLTTTLEWLQPFYKAVPPPKLNVTDVTYAEYAPVVSNLTTTLEWMVAWQGPPRYWPQKTNVTFTPTPSNLTTTLEWMVAWQGSKPTKPVHTQPVYPPTPSNLTTTLEWQIAWQGAKPSKPIHTQPFYGYPYAAAVNLTTTLEWTPAWQVPPRYQPAKILAQPFVPREATLENSLGHIAWLQPFYKAVPYPPVRHTQPVFGYPYEFAANLTTSIEWLQKWQGPPRIWPLGKPYQPFVPKEATLENTLGNIPWLQAFKGPPRYWPIKVQQTPFVPKEVVRDVVGPDKWLQAFRGSKPRKPIHTQPFYGFPYRDLNLTTSIEWLRPFTVAVKPLTARVTQPFTAIPYAQVVAAAYVQASVTTKAVATKTLFYQAWAFGTEPPSVVVPPTPPGVPPKFSHGQVHFGAGHTQVGVLTGGVCVPAFQPGGFQPTGYQTCEAPTPVVGRTGIRTARATTSSRWRKARTTVRFGTRCTPAFDAGFEDDAFQTCVDVVNKARTTTRDDP